MNMALLNTLEEAGLWLDRFILSYPRAEGLFPPPYLGFDEVLNALGIELTREEDADEDLDRYDLHRIALEPGRSKLTAGPFPKVVAWVIDDDEDRCGKTSWRLVDVHSLTDIGIDQVIDEADECAEA